MVAAGSGCLACSGTKHLFTNYPFHSFSSASRRRQSVSLSFPKHLKLMSPPPNVVEEVHDDSSIELPLFDYHRIDQNLLQNIVYDALVYATLNGLLVGDKSVQVFLLSFFYFPM